MDLLQKLILGTFLITHDTIPPMVSPSAAALETRFKLHW